MDSPEMTVIKCRLDDIIIDDKKEEVCAHIYDLSLRSTKLVIHIYMFLKCLILYNYEKNIDIPKITDDLLQLIFKTLTSGYTNDDPTDDDLWKEEFTISFKDENTNSRTKVRSPPLKGNNLIKFNELNIFYTDIYSKLGYAERISGLHLSQIFAYLKVEIITAIENNIKNNFINYIKRYVNASFKNDIDNQLNNCCSQKEKTFLRDKLKKELIIVKSDLIDNKTNSDPKYQKWITTERAKILPNEYDTSYMYDVHKNPQKYLKYMIAINLELEKLKVKQFNILPLNTSHILRYIPIDTKTLIEVLCEGKKEEYLHNLSNNQHAIWSKYFKLDTYIFNKKKYNFNYMISTDGYAVSILFLHKSLKEKKEKVNELKKKGRNDAFKLYKNKTADEITQLKQENKDKLKKNKQGYKLKQIKEKEEYNKKSKDEKTKITKERKDKKIKDEQEKKEAFDKLLLEEKNAYIKKNNELEEATKRAKQGEFPYFNELTELQLKEIDGRPLVVIDPGKIRLYTMLGNNNTVFKYSNRQRMHDTKRLEYQQKRLNYKNKTTMANIEKELDGYNSKSCKFDIFSEYVNQKNKVNKRLFTEVDDILFRKLKWYSYINTQKANDKLVRMIKHYYGANCILVMGDWSASKQQRNFISTPMIGLKRVLAKHFLVFDLDEYNTSKLNYKTEEENNNLYLWIKKKVGKKTKNKVAKLEENIKIKETEKEKEILNNVKVNEINVEINNYKEKIKYLNYDNQYGYYKIHSILTYKMENNRVGCINRDLNAVYNMRKLVEHWLMYKERPEKYRRSENPEIKTPKKKVQPLSSTVTASNVLDK